MGGRAAAMEAEGRRRKEDCSASSAPCIHGFASWRTGQTQSRPPATKPISFLVDRCMTRHRDTVALSEDTAAPLAGAFCVRRWEEHCVTKLFHDSESSGGFW